MKNFLPPLFAAFTSLFNLFGVSTSVAQWSADPSLNTPISIATDAQKYPALVSDGAGGAIIAWYDFRSGSQGDVYAQRVDSSGTVKWTTNGVPISTELGTSQGESKITTDGAGGAIITWDDQRNISPINVYAQRVDSSGTVKWTTNGVPISTTLRGLGSPVIVNDGIGGAIIAWSYGLNDSASDVYAQRVDSSGTVKWTTNGIAVSTALGKQWFPTILSDGAGGAIVTWSDQRNNQSNVYAQRVDSSGTVKWTTNGIVVSTTPTLGAEGTGPTITTDGAGGAIITWQDFRSGGSPDIYAQKIRYDGTLGLAGPSNFSYHFAFGWNMISVPLVVADYKKSILFPTAYSSAFAYQGSYVTKDTLKNGQGYWLKFNDTSTVPITGSPISLDTIEVDARWNMIGSITSPVAVTNVASIPGGIVTSNFFGYSGAYQISDSIRPGEAYWVKVNQSGKLILSSSGIMEPTNRIKIFSGSDTPPTPPDENLLNSAKGIPVAYVLEQNYPNPFNPTTTIRYALSENKNVRLTVYDVLGQEVMKLVDETQAAGYKTVSFNTNNLPSGVYFYRVQAGNFTQVKKMLLTK